MQIAGVELIYFTQKNSLDWRSRRLEIEATNISFATRLEVLEKLANLTQDEEGYKDSALAYERNNQYFEAAKMWGNAAKINREPYCYARTAGAIERDYLSHEDNLNNIQMIIISLYKVQ